MFELTFLCTVLSYVCTMLELTYLHIFTYENHNISLNHKMCKRFSCFKASPAIRNCCHHLSGVLPWPGVGPAQHTVPGGAPGLVALPW